MSVNTVPLAHIVCAVLAIAAAATLCALVRAAGKRDEPAPLPPLPPDVHMDLYADLDAFERGHRP